MNKFKFAMYAIRGRLKIAIHVLRGRPLIYNVALTQGPGAINFAPGNEHVFVYQVKIINSKVGINDAD